jgi:Zn-finger nucleic acid-binding protein
MNMPVKPSEQEAKYFLEQELKRELERARREQEAVAAAEQKRLKELHYMHCPKCGQKLLVENYGAVEVDVCGGCRGVWLDASELEAILETRRQRGPFRSFLRNVQFNAPENHYG